MESTTHTPQQCYKYLSPRHSPLSHTSLKSKLLLYEAHYVLHVVVLVKAIPSPLSESSQTPRFQRSPTIITNPRPPKTQTMLFFNLFTFLLSIPTTTTQSVHTPKPPPLPVLPIPSSPQLTWQQTELSLFLHFGPNTFTDTEWGTGRAHPSIFNPTNLDARQWVRVAKDSGFSKLILTAKHHDGFCLWPSEYTNYSVKGSPWRGGAGDVVAELAVAAREMGVGLGIYLSPWDRHEECYGKSVEYNEFYIGQMTELLTRYGEIKEVWLDGAKGEGEKDMKYFFDCWFNLIHQLQPGAVIFSDAGPDTRWVGDETGSSSSTCWSLFNRSAAVIGGTDSEYSGGGDPSGLDWVPAECDVSIRPGWFWHASQRPKSALTLLDIYYKSAGRNCLLLLNVPPNSSGLISDEDIQVLKEFADMRQSIFSHNLARNATVTASSIRGGVSDAQYSACNVLEEGIYTYWAPEENQVNWVIYLDLRASVSFNVLQVQEPIHMGQRVVKFHLDVLMKNGNWTTVTNGTTVGYRRLLQFPEVESHSLRFVVDQSRADPLISYLGIHLDSFSVVNGSSNSCSAPLVNSKLQTRVYNQFRNASVWNLFEIATKNIISYISAQLFEV